MFGSNVVTPPSQWAEPSIFPPPQDQGESQSWILLYHIDESTLVLSSSSAAVAAAVAAAAVAASAAAVECDA